MADVPLAEASVRLGLRPEALRKRLQRGTVAGHKDDQGEWVVTLPESSSPAPSLNGVSAAPPAQSVESSGGQAGGHVQDERVDTGGQAGGHVQDGLATGLGEPTLLRELVAHQRDLLDELREELAARRREVQQLHTLLAQAQQRTLPAPEGWVPGGGTGTVESPPGERLADAAAPATPERRPWWRFW